MLLQDPLFVGYTYKKDVELKRIEIFQKVAHLFPQLQLSFEAEHKEKNNETSTHQKELTREQKLTPKLVSNSNNSSKSPLQKNNFQITKVPQAVLKKPSAGKTPIIKLISKPVLNSSKKKENENSAKRTITPTKH